MASKSFRVAVAREKIEFDLEYLNNGTPTIQKFHCRPTVPVAMILDFATAMGEDGKGDGGKAMELIQGLFEAAIAPDEYPIFAQMLRDPDVGIDVTMYTDIASWLAEQYTARPTGANSPTTSPAGSSGTDSTDGASHAPLTYSRPDSPQVAAIH